MPTSSTVSACTSDSTPSSSTTTSTMTSTTSTTTTIDFLSNRTKAMEKVQFRVDEMISKLETVKPKRRNRYIRSILKYIRSFGTKGVQGIVGLLQSNDTPLVFKVSTEINRSVEHEYMVLRHLNESKSYCPHFVHTYGMISVPIPLSFFECHDPVPSESDSETGDGDEHESDEEERNNEDEDEESSVSPPSSVSSSPSTPSSHTNEEEEKDDNDEEEDDENHEEDEKEEDTSQNQPDEEEEEETSSDQEDHDEDKEEEKEKEHHHTEDEKEQEEKEDVSLFADSKEYLPKHILLLEYVERIPFYRLCRNCPDHHIVMSQILLVMMALEIAQSIFHFTHYDLHLGNIVLQQCSPNDLFLYRIRDRVFCVPTFGFYPVFIDMGISHSSEIEHHPMCISTDNYDHGFQTAVFDPLTDVHHFLLSLFYYMEMDNHKYSYISNKLLTIFRHLPVLRKSGWKRLPHNITKNMISNIKNDCSETYRSFPIFTGLLSEWLEQLNGLVILPFRSSSSSSSERPSFSPTFETFCREVHTLFPFDKLSPEQILFCTRDLVDVVNMYRETDMTNQTHLFSFRDELKRRFSMIDGSIRLDNINVLSLFRSSVELGTILSANYFHLVSSHTNLIARSYEKTSITTPLEMFVYLQSIVPLHYEFSSETMIHIWDIDEKRYTKTSCSSLSSEQLRQLNLQSWTQKSHTLSSYFHLSPSPSSSSS